MYYLTCICCEETFPAKRRDAKTCSDACRKEIERRKNIPDILNNAMTQIDRINWSLAHRQSPEARKALLTLQHHIEDALHNNS